MNQKNDLRARVTSGILVDLSGLIENSKHECNMLEQSTYLNEEMIVSMSVVFATKQMTLSEVNEMDDFDLDIEMTNFVTGFIYPPITRAGTERLKQIIRDIITITSETLQPIFEYYGLPIETFYAYKVKLDSYILIRESDHDECVSITYLIQLSDLVENKLYPALSLESLHYNMDLFLGEHAFYKGKSVFLYETLAEKEIVSLMDEMYYCESMSAFSRLNHEMSVLIFMEEIKKFLDTKKISVRKIEIAILGDAVIIKTEN